MDDVTIAERFVRLETLLEVLIESSSETKQLIVEHIKNDRCDVASCVQGPAIKAVGDQVKTYKQWTWATFAAVCIAGLTSTFWPKG